MTAPLEIDRLTPGFLQRAWSVVPVESPELLDGMRDHVRTILHTRFDLPEPIDLARLHEHATIERINEMRLQIYNEMNRSDDLLERYYGLAARALQHFVGNELASQNKVNLSIQMPADPTSRLGLHVDATAGQSPYEIVLWVPLTDAFATNSMFVYSRAESREMLSQYPEYQNRGMDALQAAHPVGAEWLTVRYGEALIFSPTLMHGNVVNRTAATRVSLNARFKGLFSPYTALEGSEKKLGSFYKPFMLRPATRIGLDYEEPAGF